MLCASSGQILWSLKMQKPIFASPVWFSQEICLIASVDGYLSSLDDSGKTLWRFKSDAPIFSSPRVFSERYVLFGCHDHHLYCVDGKNGSAVWKTKFTSPVYSSPNFYQSTVICCDTEGILSVLDVSNGKILVQKRLDGQVFSSPAIIEDYILIGCRDNYLYCYNISLDVKPTSYLNVNHL